MKKVLSVLLAVCLLVGCLPMAASAMPDESASVTPRGDSSVTDALSFLLKTIYNSGQTGSDGKGYLYIDALIDNDFHGEDYILITFNVVDELLEFTYVSEYNNADFSLTNTVFFDYDLYTEDIKGNSITFVTQNNSYNSESSLKASLDMHTHVADSDLAYRRIGGSGSQPDANILYRLANSWTRLAWKAFDVFLRAKCGLTLADIGFLKLDPFGLSKTETTAVTGVSLNKTALAIKTGETASLIATVSPSDATNTSVTWSSSDNAIATVDANGKIRAVSPGTATIKVITADGAYTASCIVAVSPKEQPPILPTQFIDVPAGEYYVDAVKWAVENNITSGTDNTHFSPNSSCTRAQAVTFLWRTAGKPEPKGDAAKFQDVKPGDYYEKAVQWAVENGITSGTDPGKFSPNAVCTRAQIVTFLYRAENSPEITGNNSFIDVSAGAYYENAVNWAVKNNITSGTGGNRFSPENNCVRGQIVTFLYRYSK